MLNSQIETVTLPREVVQQAIDALEGVNKRCSHMGYVGLDGQFLKELVKVIGITRAALDAPAKVDCRGCKHHRAGLVGTGCYVSLDTGKPVRCTDFDKFQALPPIVLTNITKAME